MRIAPLSALSALAVLLVLAVSQEAVAASCAGRPGSSAVEQYCEAIPSAGGSQVSKQDDDRSTKRPKVSSSAVEELRGSGGDGAAVLQLTGGDRPAAARKRPARRASNAKATSQPKARSTSASTPASTAGPSPSGNVLHAVATSATSGPAASGGLIWILLATMLAVAASAWISFRRRAD